MKIMIASDIHGSSDCCCMMLSAFERENACRLVLLGDLLYHGPRNDLPYGYAPKEVASMLNSVREKLLCVRGNCDAEVDQMLLDFPIMADYAVMPEGTHLLYFTHGHVWNKDNLPPLSKGDVMIMGHTHVPCSEEASGIRVLNPGSVSIPKGGSQKGYMTMENGIFIWKTLEGVQLGRLEI